MRSRVLPTTDLYFLNGCRRSLSRWWRAGPVERLGANCFRRGDDLLLIRRDEPSVIERAIGWPGNLIYLIDDDIDAAARSPSLPAPYRERLALFAAGFFDRLLRRCDTLVAASDVLAERLRADPRVTAPVRRIDPFWALPLAGQDHFARREGAWFDIAHLGSGSHTGGLTRVTRPVLAVLARFPEARFTYFGIPGGHPELEAHPRVRRHRPMRWGRYRRWLPRQRFHLGLYPLEATAFDRARSVNKIIEHAISGAVGVYGADWQPAARLGDAAILAPPDLADWEATLVDAVTQRHVLASRAATAAKALAPLCDPAMQREYWSRTLSIPD